ncbi:MAG TPA: hypothetical protein VNJ02_06830, partial [Vicinamibacterales bacterium]|nr:hypothetical protein [Vicinamibacterales bacterium]
SAALNRGPVAGSTSTRHPVRQWTSRSPDEGQKVGLVVGPESNHPISPDPQRRVTVSGGEVWLYGQPGKVTLTAHRR